MSELLQLGVAERYYFGSFTEEKTPVTLTIVPKDESEPVKTERNYRNAGRKKLTPVQILLNAKKAELARLARLEARDQKSKEREQRLQQKAETRNARRARATKAEEVTETLLRLRNIREVEVTRPAVRQVTPQPAKELPAGLNHSVGAPVMEGKIAVRIDHKTVIYIKPGTDPDQAIHCYRYKHGLTL